MTTVTVTDEQLELLRRETMKTAATDMETLAEALRRLADVAPWPSQAESIDIPNMRDQVQESMSTLDALGWPDLDPPLRKDA